MKFSVVVLVSRPEYLNTVTENLEKLELPGSSELVVMIDNSNIGDSFVTEEIKKRFYATTIKNISHTKPPSGASPQARNRISQVRNESKPLVGDTHYVFSFEDDTVIPADAFMKLSMNIDDKTGVISGVQVGRHTEKIIGAWFADHYWFPSEFTTLGKNEITTPLVSVSGTGMYCYITPTKTYKEAQYGWHMPVGPDVWYGLFCLSKGLTVRVDQSVVCGHRIPNGKVLTPDNVDVVKIKYTKDEKGNWDYRHIKQ